MATARRVGTESVAAIFLGVIALAALGHLRDGTLREWLAGKFLSRGEVAPALPGSASTITTNSAGGTAQFGDPVPSASLISPFGVPRDGGARSHEGIDLGAPRGTPVVAVADGQVKIATSANSGRCGREVSIAHANGWRSIYCHLDTIAPLTIGGTVRRGQVLGTIGNTGNAATTGPHLHFELRRNGIPQNPAPLVGR